MNKTRAVERKVQRSRRHASIRRRVRGTPDRPRLVVFRSLKHMEGQLVDDSGLVTLLGVSTRAAEVARRLEEKDGGKVAASFEAGRLLAERAQKAGVRSVVFDRGGYRFHGRVKAFAEGAREGGLRF
ncbi:MAG: 50S ribosomal protein L18 [Gemmatimonadota bacterium]